MSDDDLPVPRNQERMLNNLSSSDLQEAIVNFERTMYPRVANRLNILEDLSSLLPTADVYDKFASILGLSAVPPNVRA
jgi:hypothetical protein